MWYRSSKTPNWLAVCVAVLLAAGCGTSDEADPGVTGGTSGTGGSAGTGGTGGTGGTTGGIEVVVPQCVSSAYQVVFRAFAQPLDPILRYLDTPEDMRDASQKPPIVSLSELKTVPDVYSRFTWNANDVPDVEDPSQTFIQADFIEGGETNLDLGIFNGNVVLLPWEMRVDDRLVGEGKFSIVGLDNDTVRMTIVDFNPTYENLCTFEIFNFNLHLDLATEGSEPFAVQIGYTAEGPGYTIENGWITFGEGDSAGFTGEFKLGTAAGIPFDFTLDYSTDPAGISGTFGGVPSSCTIDLATFVVVC